MLSPHVPDLDALDVLLAVASTGSINAAARQVGLSQQAVSARVAAIEAQTGVVLVTRSPRGSQLTTAGILVAEWATRLLDIAAELDVGLATLRRDRTSTLRVSASLTVAEQLLPGWLVTLRSAATARGDEPPAVLLHVGNSETVLARVRGDEADLGFVEHHQVPRSLRSRAVGHDHLLVVTRPDHPWARRRAPLIPAELAATPLVSREAGSGTRGVLEAALRRVLGADTAIAPPSLALASTSAIRAAVIADAGPAVLSELAVTDDITAGRLTAIPVADLDLRRTLRAVWQGGRLPPAGPARDLVAVAGLRRE